MTINTTRFDLKNPVVVLRILCGAFFLPHLVFKLVAFSLVSAFFAKAGLRPPELFVALDVFAETACVIGLVFDICTRWAALLSAAVLAVSALAVCRVSGFAWVWSGGGIEYPVLWACISLIVARLHWQTPARQVKPA